MECILDGAFDFNDPVWEEVSEEAKNFISYLLTYDEVKRPSAEEALQHPWLKDAHTKRASGCSKRRENTRLSLGFLQSFQANFKLKQCVCSLIASQLLKKEEKEEIDAVFRTLDFDCDGKLTPADLKQSYREFFGQELSNTDIKLVFDQVNYSKSGAIEYSEFVASTLMEKYLVDETKLRAAFHIFDIEDKGFISNEDLRRALALDESMDDYVANKIILQVDTNGDGQIQYNEFKDMMFADTMAKTSTIPSKDSERTSPRTTVTLTIEEERFEDGDASEEDDPLVLSFSGNNIKSQGFKSVLQMFQDKAKENDVPFAFRTSVRDASPRAPVRA